MSSGPIEVLKMMSHVIALPRSSPFLSIPSLRTDDVVFKVLIRRPSDCDITALHEEVIHSTSISQSSSILATRGLVGRQSPSEVIIYLYVLLLNHLNNLRNDTFKVLFILYMSPNASYRA
jgi:hypothetical protein